MKWIIVIAVIIAIYYFANKKKSPNKPKVLESPFNYWIIHAGEDIPLNKWYQKESAKNKNFISYKEDWGPDWKYASPIPGESNVKVAGISRENRPVAFLKLAQLHDFKMFLEDEPTNPVNENARKVMIAATVDGVPVTEHIGYLPDDVANEYAGVELNISPKSAFLPTSENLNLGVEVTLLQRSAHYLKRKAKEDANKKR